MNAISAHPHPDFRGCLFVPAESAAHAWQIMHALDRGGFRAGYPMIVDGLHGVAVVGDAVTAPDIEKVCAAVVPNLVPA